MIHSCVTPFFSGNGPSANTHRIAQITIANKLCTNYVAEYTGYRGGSEVSLKPGITLFSKNDEPGLFGGSSMEALFLRMQLFVKLKTHTYYDPFRDLPDGGMEEERSNSGHETRRQCFPYAANQLAYQHRLFVFSLVICGNRARFIRWDREGAVVSAGIDCSRDPDLVIEFLRRFNQLTDKQRGLDPTATPATPEQVEMFEAAVAKIDIESLKPSVGDRKIYPRFRLEVSDSDNTSSYYIVGRALDYCLGVVGRCTRGYLALDLSTKEWVFLKDMWRPDTSGVEPEHVWYEKLIKARVPHLVKFKHASDVIPSIPPCHYHGTPALDDTTTTGRQGAQRGLTHRLAGLFDPSDSSLQGRVHYRLVQRELCRPLSEFTNSNHLVLVMLHSLKGRTLPIHIYVVSLLWVSTNIACSCAFSVAKLFHRDASLGNIMIGLDDEGKLNDWDLCRGVNVDKGMEGPRAVRGSSLMVVSVFTFFFRGPGSSCRPGCSRTLRQATRSPTTSSRISSS